MKPVITLLTTIIVATPSRILVLDAGRVVGMGTHAELLAGNETYREIVYSQMSEQEAAA